MNRQILVVEDEAPIREMITFVLEQNGFNVIAAADYAQAKALLTDPLPDLVLLDWMLPGGSGITIAKEIKRNDYTKKIPIIMLTARADEDDKVMGWVPRSVFTSGLLQSYAFVVFCSVFIAQLLWENFMA